MAVTKTFVITSCGRDEYPGDGLRLGSLNKDFLSDMGIDVKEGDEVEVSVRIVSHLEQVRVPHGGTD